MPSSSKRAVKQNKATGARPTTTKHNNNNSDKNSPPHTTIISNTSSSSSSSKIINTKCVSGTPSKYVLAERFRTQLCRHYNEKAQCPYADRCMFAHGAQELRTYEESMQDGLFTEEAIKGWRRAMRLVQRERQQGGGVTHATTATATQLPQPQSQGQQQTEPQHQRKGAEVPQQLLPPAQQPHTPGHYHIPQQQYEHNNTYSDGYYYPHQQQQQQQYTPAPYYYNNDSSGNNYYNYYYNEGVVDYNYSNSAPILSPRSVHHCNNNSSGEYCCDAHNSITPLRSDNIIERTASGSGSCSSLGQASVDVCASVSEGLVRDKGNINTVVAGSATTTKVVATHHPYARTH